MNLLYCAGCRHAFVTPAGNDSQLCVLCGGVLRILARDVVQVSPLGNGHESRAIAGGAEVPVTSVALRRRRTDDRGDPLLEVLSEYFEVVATDGGAQVCVDRGPPIDAASRVAAVLDGIDERWEEHFFLPELDQSKTDAGV